MPLKNQSRLGLYTHKWLNKKPSLLFVASDSCVVKDEWDWESDIYFGGWSIQFVYMQHKSSPYGGMCSQRYSFMEGFGHPKRYIACSP